MCVIYIYICVCMCVCVCVCVCARARACVRVFTFLFNYAFIQMAGMLTASFTNLTFCSQYLQLSDVEYKVQ